MLSPLQVASVPPLVAPNTRQLPSASLMYAGPPESPSQAPERGLPIDTARPAMSLMVTSTAYLLPDEPLALVRPKPASTALAPSLMAAVSHPMRMGTSGTSVPGWRSRQK